MTEEIKIKISIGDNLRVLRNKQNLSQQLVADFLGVDRKTYVSWESGTADIKSSFLPRIATLFQVEINDLFRKKMNSVTITHNSENKNVSANNSVVVLLTDKDAVAQLVDIIKKKGCI